MKLKRHPVLYAFLSLLLAGVLFMAWLFLFYLEKPVIRTMQVKLDKYSTSDTLPISLTLGIYNPNRFALAFDSLQYSIFIEDELNASGASHHGRSLEAGEEGRLRLPVRLAFSPAVKKAIRQDRDSAAFAFRFRVFTHIGRFSIPLSHTFTRDLPLFKTLNPVLDSIRVETIGLKHSSVKAFITLKNPNQIKFHSTRMQYELYSGTDLLAQGDTTADKTLKPHSSIQLQLPIAIRSGRFFKDMVLFKKKSASKPYRLIFHISLKTGTDSPPQTIHLTVERHGPLEELQKALRKESGKLKIRL